MQHLTLASAFVAAALTTGCTASVQKPAIEAITANDQTRAEAFEATLRVLDEHPGYVDEFFLLAKRHRPTLDRFVANTARDAREPELARLVAEHLMEHPESLREVVIQSLDASVDAPEARAAIGRAIEERAATAADIAADHPPAMKAVTIASVRSVARKPEARAAVLAAVHETSPALAQILINNPKTLTTVMEDVLAAGGAGLVGDLVKAAITRDGDAKAPRKNEKGATKKPQASGDGAM